ncbi:MAG: hypothetical protein ACYCVW_17040 [Rhodocyclaceae bacterium]
MSAASPEAVRLARASWDAATPATRVLFFLRSKRSALRKLEGDELDEVPFRTWDQLPPETCEALAWDVQFLSNMLRGGREALRASEGLSVAPMRVVK